MIKIAVLASGTGRHLQNFIDLSDDLNIKIDLVITDNNKALALKKAEKANIPCYTRALKRRESVEKFSEDIFDRLREREIELVCLAGFLKLLKIPKDFERRVINIHPSLIPEFCGRGFYGMKVHEAVSRAKVKQTGCTIHFCDDIYDHGPIILQKSIDITPDLSPQEIAKRVFELEIEAYPEAINSLLTKTFIKK